MLRSLQCLTLRDRGIVFRQEEVWRGVGEMPNKSSNFGMLLTLFVTAETCPVLLDGQEERLALVS